MQIQLVHNSHFYLDGYCGTCGESFTPDAVIAIAYSQTGTEIGAICDQCLHAGCSALRQRVQRRAAMLRQRAEALERLAEEDVTFPGRADWQALDPGFAQHVQTGDYLTGIWYESLSRTIALYGDPT